MITILQPINESRFTSNSTEREQAVGYLKIFFDFQYFLLNSPFRLKLERTEVDDSCRVTVKSWLPQKILCGFLTILGFVWLSGVMRTCLPAKSKDPSLFLLMVLFVVWVLARILRVKIYWFEQANLVAILNHILDRQNELSLPTTSPLLKFILTSKKCLIAFGLICTLYIALPITNLLAGMSLDSGKNVNEPHETWWPRMIRLGRRNFFLGNVTSDTGDTIVGVLTALGFGWRQVVGTNIQPLVFLVSFLAWLPSKGFAEQLLGSTSSQFSEESKGVGENKCTNSRQKCWIEIRKEYEIVKKLMSMINGMFGWSNCYFLIELILYYCVTIDKIFWKEYFPDWINIWSNAVFLSIQVGAFLLAADICEQVTRQMASY